MGEILKKEVDSVKEEVLKLNQSIRLERKLRRLEWAVTNTEEKSYPSIRLVRNILTAFRRDLGTNIQGESEIRLKLSRVIEGVRFDDYYGNETEIEQSEKEFRDKLSTLIHALTNIKPRITKEN